MAGGTVRLAIEGPVAHVTFERPEARNAMTFAMYNQLLDICARIDETPDLRLAVLRGSGAAFIAGTDIAEFLELTGGEDGLAYEEQVETVVARVETLKVPTLAVVDGPAMGGGLVLATACDLRIVSERAKFGVPIARTLGNCLSIKNLARLERNFGVNATRKMLLCAAVLGAAEVDHLGFALNRVAPEAIDHACQSTIDVILQMAPLTLWSAREGLRRLGQEGPPEDADLIQTVYASEDFRHGVRAFLDKREAEWSGQ